jgi:hypothetical protein
MKRIILFILLLFVAASCQTTKVPSKVAWNFEYRMAHPDTLADSLKYLYDMSDYDSSNVHFRVFAQITPDTTNPAAWDSIKFDTLGLVKQPTLELWLLEHKELYIDTTFSFFVQAALIDSSNRQYNQSAYSDTIHVFIPILPIGSPIELIVIDLPLE